MSLFTYTFIDASGTRKNASIEGRSDLDIAQHLDKQGIAVIEIKKAGVNAGLYTQGTAKRGRVTRRELIEFCIYLGSLCESGLPIIAALRDFSAETQNTHFKHILGSLQFNVESGQTLSDGMRMFPKVFSNEFIHLIKAGEQTGTLPHSFKELRSYLEWLERIAGDIKQATTYPLTITVALGIFILYVFSSVIPKITGILVSMNLELPLVTRIIMGISAFTTKTWWVFILAGIAVPFMVKIASRKTVIVADMLDKMKLNIPVFGALIRMIIQARFTQNFSVLHRAGISILENIELCKGFIGNRMYAAALERVLYDLQSGESFTASLKASNLFSGLVIRMVSIGEASGDLENSLKHAAAYYDEEVPRRIKRVFGILEPLIIVLLVSVIGMVAVAVFLPILSISQGLR